jgi:hypothetical protein
MTASANTAFDLSRTGIVRLAYQTLQVVTAGEDPDIDQLAMGSDFLNVLIKELENEGIYLSKLERTTTTLVAGTAQYTPASNTLDIDQRTPYVTGDGIDVPVKMITRGEYMALPLKTTQGQPTQMYVEKGQTLSFFLYPVPDSTWTSITYPRVLMLTDMDSAAVTSGLPSKYLATLYLGLAVKLAPAHGKLSMLSALQPLYEQAKGKALNDDTEKGGLRFVPSYGMRWWR